MLNSIVEINRTIVQAEMNVENLKRFKRNMLNQILNLPNSSSSNRPTHDEYFLAMAFLVSTRATCARRAAGCILVNSRNHVLATGYNGVPAGMPHCTSSACDGANSLSGRDLDRCEATHAEQNALLQCKDCYQIETCYTTCSPCVTCTKLLLNTSCRRIVFFEEYPHPKSKTLWEQKQDSLLLGKREWIKHESPTATLVQARFNLETADRVSRPNKSQ